jgi:hypothetical protein
MNTTPRLPARLEEPVPTETEAHGFNETAAYLLALVLQDDPRLPALTAGAMVTRVREFPIGGDLVTPDVTLRRLETCKPSELTTSERRMTAVLLKDLISQAHALLSAMT